MPPSHAREAGDAVAAAADGDGEVLLAREARRPHDVGDAGTAGDQGRAAVDRAVPDRARLVVVRVARTDELAAQALLELGERGLAERGWVWLQWP